MSLFDLLLLFMFLGTIVGCAAVVLCIFLQRWRVTKQISVFLALSWVIYLTAGTLVAIMTPQRLQPVGKQRCYDEMCFTVTRSEQADSIASSSQTLRPVGVFHIVMVDVASQSRGRTQRERDAEGVIIDRAGHRYRESQTVVKALTESWTTTTLDTPIEPGGQQTVELVYDVPRDTGPLNWTFGKSSWINPARLVIGDDMHFLHKPTITPVR